MTPSADLERLATQATTHTRMDMDALAAELRRLGCGFRDCGIHGFIFAPQNSGGLRIEDDCLHFWDLGVNVYYKLETARERLAMLPDNTGYECVCSALLEIEPE